MGRCRFEAHRNLKQGRKQTNFTHLSPAPPRHFRKTMSERWRTIAGMMTWIVGKTTYNRHGYTRQDLGSWCIPGQRTRVLHPQH